MLDKTLCVVNKIDAINTLPLTNAPAVIGLNDCAEIAYNNQFMQEIWNQFSPCDDTLQQNGSYFEFSELFILSCAILSVCDAYCVLTNVVAYKYFVIHSILN